MTTKKLPTTVSHCFTVTYCKQSQFGQLTMVIHSLALRKKLLFLIGFSIPISTALTNILCPLVVVLLLLEGDYTTKLRFLRHHPVAIAASLLFGLMLAGLSYSPVSGWEALMMLDKYRELLYIPMFILLFQEETTARCGRYGFLSAMGLTLFLSYLMVVTGWELGKGSVVSPVVFKNYITQGLLLSLAAYFLAVQGWQNRPRWRWLFFGPLVGLASYNIIFLNQSRTGYVVMIVLILLFMYQIQRWRGILLGLVIVVVLSGLAYQTSPVMQQRLEKISTGLVDYQQGEETSVPMRLSFLKNSLLLWSQHPFLGHGTGSFSYKYQQLAQPQGLKLTANPHNEFLMIAVQWGLVGMALFIYLLYQLWRTSFRLSQLSPGQNWMAQGVVMTMTVGCLFNSLLLDTTEGHLFAYLVGVFWGRLPVTQNLQSSGEPWLLQLPWRKIISRHLAPVSALLALLIPTWLVYYGFIVPSYQPLLLIAESKLVDGVMAKITQPSSSLLWNQQITVNLAPTTTTIQTQHPLTFMVALTEEIKLATQFSVTPSQIGQAGYVILLVSYQPSTAVPTEAKEIMLQRRGPQWLPMVGNYLSLERYFLHLPATIEVPIYQGPLLLPGKMRVWVGYWVESNHLKLENLVLQEVARLVVIEKEKL